jgi:NADP-dependent 3-hydroxy acid dehydrogenase YdfG
MKSHPFTAESKKAIRHATQSHCPKSRQYDFNMPQLVWLITGCSSGFGEQFVHSILARGDKVIATGRKLEKLQHLEPAGAAILQLDITDSQQSIRDTTTKAISIYGKIDVLVNNASYVQIGTWEDLE